MASTTTSAHPAPVYPEGDPLDLIHISFLNSHGFVNLPYNQYDPGFASFPPHTSVQKPRWVGVGTREMKLIKDSVVLFSRILASPELYPIFKGLYDTHNYHQFHPSAVKFATKPTEARWFQPEGSLADTRNVQELYKEVRRASRQIRWRFGIDPEDGNCYGITQPRTTVWQPGDNTIGADIALSAHYLDALDPDTDLASRSFYAPWTPGSDDDSARLRTKVHLAITMFHEFIHALYVVWNDHWSDSIPPRYIAPDEPYYRDQRQAELGFAFENKVVSGKTEPMMMKNECCAYGLCVTRWPDMQRHSTDGSYELMSAAKWGQRWVTSYAIPMAWVQSLFTTTFWNSNVPRLSLIRAMHPPRFLGFRIYPEQYMVYHNESPDIDGQPIKPPPSPNVSITSVEGDTSPHGGLVAHGPYAHMHIPTV